MVIKQNKSSNEAFGSVDVSQSRLSLAKTQLARSICQVIEERSLTQIEAAEILGINQPKVSAIVGGRLDGFSLDRLLKFLNLLDRDIEIVVRPHTDPNHEAGIRVS